MKWKSGVNIRPVFQELHRFQLILLPVGQSTNVGFLKGRPASLIMPPAGGPPVVRGIPVLPRKRVGLSSENDREHGVCVELKFVFFNATLGLAKKIKQTSLEYQLRHFQIYHHLGHIFMTAPTRSWISIDSRGDFASPKLAVS